MILNRMPDTYASEMAAARLEHNDELVFANIHAQYAAEVMVNRVYAIVSEIEDMAEEVARFAESDYDVEEIAMRIAHTVTVRSANLRTENLFADAVNLAKAEREIAALGK